MAKQVPISEMHTETIKFRIGVLITIKKSMNFTGRELPQDDANKLADFQLELARRVEQASADWDTAHGIEN